MATHRKTEYADALEEQSASLQTVAERLAAGPLGEQERLRLAFRMSREAIWAGGLSGAIRRGDRWPESRRTGGQAAVVDAPLPAA